MSKKSLFVGLLFAAVLTGANATAAFAGEITGNGKRTAGLANANSICVFSGKNDDPEGLDPKRPRRGLTVLRPGKQAGSGRPS